MILKFLKLTAALLFCGMVAAAQSYHTLTPADFQGSPRKMNFAAVAYTNCSISYNYSVKRVRGIYRIDFDVSMVMNRNLSWLDRDRIKSADMMAEVLRHEQGHYLIAYLQQQEVIRAFNQTNFGRDYAIVIPQIFNRIDAKYQRMNEDYEHQTNHMQNRNQQLRWNSYLASCLQSSGRLMASY